MSGKVVRVKSWEEFKQLIIKHNPQGIAYNIEQGFLQEISQVSDLFCQPKEYNTFLSILLLKIV